MKVELWSSDLFDRESEPALEGEFTGLAPGLAALWEHVLGEGVMDDGRPTFTDFQLRLAGKPPVSIPRDPLDNPELATLRAHRFTRDFFENLARIHSAHVDRHFDFELFLALTPPIPVKARQAIDIFRGALSITTPLRRTARGWRAGEAVRLEVTTSYLAGTGALSSWTVNLWGLQFDGKPVRFAIHCEEHDSGASWKVDSDASPATQPLRDALMAAGF